MISLRHVSDRFWMYNLKLKPKKCSFLRSEVEFLGRRVSKEGVSVAPGKEDVIKQWPTPTNKKELECFLGYANYHRTHVQGYAGITACLYTLLKPKACFIWTDEHEDAFVHLKKTLSSAPCLAFPLPDGAFILDCDASDTARGADLSQMQGEQERTIVYASHVLTPLQRRYCTTRKELLAVVKFCRHFRHYLLGRSFTVRSDHNSLAWLTRFRHIEGQLARWLEDLAQYDFQILHRQGLKHSNADGLSRIADPLSACVCYQA